jgi:branched-chain amino acid transport system ATP-binding protein
MTEHPGTPLGEDAARAVLEVDNLTAGYDRVDVLSEVSIRVDKGEAIAILGRNGAGKSTLLRTVSRITRVRRGSITVLGEDVTRAKPPQVCRLGVAHVPEGRHVFSTYSVEDNLRLGGYAWKRAASRSEFENRITWVCEHFPELASRRRQEAGTLSGGEQQMLAIGMALMASPQLLMLDEPSLGLAPVVVSRVFDAVRRLRDAGTTILIVEQLVRQTLALVDRAYVLDLGHIVAAGTPQELQADPQVLETAYLG